ncbi:MAG: hypothetical protein JEZ11_03500 [Desulfobacterales bacterium]|nr:hypothetical protein [Desulfobacterales bacterium]
MCNHRYDLCHRIDATCAATCDRETYDYIVHRGGKAVMTADTHERCTDRTAEALLKIEAENDRKADIVVMVQRDEPMVTPEMIEIAVDAMIANPDIQVVNLMAAMKTDEEFEDSNEVKVVVELNGDALYFSREPIP